MHAKDGPDMLYEAHSWSSGQGGAPPHAQKSRHDSDIPLGVLSKSEIGYPADGPAWLSTSTEQRLTTLCKRGVESPQTQDAQHTYNNHNNN